MASDRWSVSDLSITADGHELTAEWTGTNPNTRRGIEAALPLSGDANRWGEELYFRTDVDVPAENAQVEVPVGSIAYWPEGNAICLFWGPTPASRGNEPRAASPVNVVAEMDDVDALSAIDGGARVSIERIDG